MIRESRGHYRSEPTRASAQIAIQMDRLSHRRSAPSHQQMLEELGASSLRHFALLACGTYWIEFLPTQQDGSVFQNSAHKVIAKFRLSIADGLFQRAEDAKADFSSFAAQLLDHLEP